ncbi:alpha/beta fold hydrolase [Salisediminibacterium beveridgei]|uniref:Alpha/beta hydrolase fold protein n=1 Tax=Salisediminibacterium beveridgei TaxID=632773 RepID=A0A1D7QZM5_9BACI|nr:alpha/beta hydrolase [Salisediminibacterium beveridgei]AOM84410.1 Alpha/beta hydrolase fold protein [Salisediminibacterium beveridgei]
MLIKIIIAFILIVSVIFLVLFGYTTWKTKQVEQAIPPAGDVVSVLNGELDVHYVREGSGDPVVLLHGRDGTLQEFTLSVMDELAKDYDVIAIDRPGYGYTKSSNPEHFSTKQQARIVNDALSELEIENPVIVGHSYGGAVMLQYLLDYPEQVRGALSLAGVAYQDEPPTESFYALPRYPVIGPLLTNTVIYPLGGMMADNIYDQAFHPADAPETYVNVMSSLYLRPKQFTATAHELAHMYDSVTGIQNHYAKIQTPVTILFGDQDQILDHKQDGERLHEALPDSTYLLIENGGHKIHHTHTSEFLDALDELMEKSS